MGQIPALAAPQLPVPKRNKAPLPNTNASHNQGILLPAYPVHTLFRRRGKC
jgi:hypothetical protein